MSESLLEKLRQEVDERQEYFNEVLLVLEKRAANESGWAKWIRSIIIFLGALVATREVASPPNSPWVIGFYTCVGLLIATLGGVEAAFGYQRRASELRILSAECKSYILELDCQIPLVEASNTVEAQIEAANQLIKLQNEKLTDIQVRAARSDVNITRKVRKLKTRGEPSHKMPG